MFWCGWAKRGKVRRELIYGKEKDFRVRKDGAEFVGTLDT